MNGGSGFLGRSDPVDGANGVTVGDFWRWAYSDILSNRNRSVFAEYIVGVALGCVGAPRIEWDSADLQYGDIKIEVKSAADCQSWHQEKTSLIRFGIRKATVWNPATGKYVGDRTRCAHMYVFCHYPEQDRAKVNVLNVAGWDFYVISTALIDREFAEAKSLSLAAIKRMAESCKFDKLRATVDRLR